MLAPGHSSQLPHRGIERREPNGVEADLGLGQWALEEILGGGAVAFHDQDSGLLERPMEGGGGKEFLASQSRECLRGQEAQQFVVGLGEWLKSGSRGGPSHPAQRPGGGRLSEHGGVAQVGNQFPGLGLRILAQPSQPHRDERTNPRIRVLDEFAQRSRAPRVSELHKSPDRFGAALDVAGLRRVYQFRDPIVRRPENLLVQIILVLGLGPAFRPTEILGDQTDGKRQNEKAECPG